MPSTTTTTTLLPPLSSRWSPSAQPRSCPSFAASTSESSARTSSTASSSARSVDRLGRLRPTPHLRLLPRRTLSRTSARGRAQMLIPFLLSPACVSGRSRQVATYFAAFHFTEDYVSTTAVLSLFILNRALLLLSLSLSIWPGLASASAESLQKHRLIISRRLSRVRDHQICVDPVRPRAGVARYLMISSTI